MTVYSEDSDGGVMLWWTMNKLMQGQATSKMMTYQFITNNTKLVYFPGLDVMKFHKTLLLALRAAHQTKYLLLNVGPIVLTNDTGPKDFTYKSLLGQFITGHTRYTDPISQHYALRLQLEQLSNIYSNSKSTWEKAEKSAGRYLGQLKMDSSGDRKYVGGRKCYKCGSPDHYKKDCPKKKAAGGNHGGNNSSGNGNGTKKWYHQNKDGKKEILKNGTKYYWSKTCGYNNKGCWVSTHKPED